MAAAGRVGGGVIKGVEFTYLHQPPKRWTFEQPQLKRWVERYCYGKVLNLFAGKTLLSVDEFRVDIDEECSADVHVDAYEFVSSTDMLFDTIILDPPTILGRAERNMEDGTLDH